MKSLAALALMFVSAGAFATNGADTLTVTVLDQNNNPIQGADVAAIFFNSGNPDANASQVAATNNSGVATFSNGTGNGLVAGDQYTIVASTQGYAPNIVGQFNTGSAPSILASATAQAATIRLTQTSGLGEIDVNLNYASTGTIVFGQIGLQAGGGAVEYSAALVVAGSGSGGNGTLHFRNIALAAANTYVVGAFDALQNRFVSQQVGQALNAGNTPLTLAAPLSFFQAPPPITNLSQTQQNGSGGGLSISGVVTDTTTAANPIPWAGINLGAIYTDQYGQTHNDWRGAGADQNGNYSFYGLTPGTSYYVSMMGSCANQGPNAGTCYAGFQDAIGSFTANDFFYASSGTVLTKNFQLKAQPPSTGHLAINIVDQFGATFPQSGVGIYPDPQQWSTAGGVGCGGFMMNPGSAQINTFATTGYALLSGLPSGNYNLSAWTPYGQTNYNQPGCTCSQTGCTGCYQGMSSCTGGGNFSRLFIDTAVAGNDAKIYDIYGNLANQVSSVTIVVNVSTSGTGVVQGSLTFPGVSDLSNSPIIITLFVNCSGQQQCPPNTGGYKVLKSSAQPANSTYQILVSSGYRYNMNIQTSYWGAVQNGGGQQLADLSLSTSAAVNLKFVPAGRIVGTLRKPDGSAYIVPSGSNNNGSNPGVFAEGGNSWGGANINNDGSFTIGGLLPGNYVLNASNWGSANFPYTGQQPLPTITVVANQDARQDILLANAVRVRPIVRPTNNPLSVLPPVAMIACGNNNGHGDCPADSLDVLSLPAGSPLNSGNVSTFLAHADDNVAEFTFSPSTGQIQGHCDGQFMTQPGFCTKVVPAQPNGTSYDYYLMRKGNFDSANRQGGARPFFVIEASSKNIVVSPTNVNDFYFDPFSGMGGSTAPVQDVDITPPSLAALQQAALSGTVTLSVNSLITQQQFQNLGGDFSKFLHYLPIVWVYDSTGTLKAAGMVVPYPPAEAPFEGQLQGAVANGNYAGLVTMMGSAPAGWGPVGYEIRGLTAGQTYSIVATTPNYPPVKTSVTLGAAQSTTTLNIDFTLNAGVSLSGVVKDTNSVVVAGAQVTIAATGYGPTVLTTDNTGSWSVNGLGAGQYQITVVAPGFAQGAQTATVGASNVNAGTLTLSYANASISGTVYTNNPICPPGTVCAAFGKTVLQGITVVAYDDTLSSSTTGPLPLYKTVTNSSGAYTLSGLLSGDAYTVFAAAPGYFIVSSITTPSPTSTGIDFSLKPKPLSVDVYGSPVGSNYEFQIRNYKQFSSGKAYIGAVGFSTSPCGAGCTDASNSFQQKPDASGATELVLDYALSNLVSGTNYQLIIVAQPNDPTASPVVKIVNFGLGIPNNTCQNIDALLLGDQSSNAQGLASNVAPLDASGGNSSGIQMPVGGIIPTVSTAVPSLCMTQQTITAGAFGTSAIGTESTLPTNAFVSGVYTVTLSSINYNKGINLTLSYNQNGSNLSDLAVYAFNATTNQWKPVTGTQTIDPVRGTISMTGVKNLVSIAALDVAQTPQAGRFTALFDGHQHRVNPLAAGGSDQAQFAILKPSVAGGSFAGTQVKIYNYPNPFNLTSKNVPTNQTSNVCGSPPASVATNGTVIKIEAPAGVSGTAAVRIYTLSGRLVRELDAGNLSGSGQCVYLPWDGLNRSGQQVADGVYYGIFTVNGNKSGDAHGIFKMAVVK